MLQWCFVHLRIYSKGLGNGNTPNNCTTHPMPGPGAHWQIVLIVTVRKRVMVVAQGLVVY
jgi:hypothetical protein